VLATTIKAHLISIGKNMRIFKTARIVLLSVALSAGHAHAEVSESIDYDYYRVEHYPGEGLKDALTDATPYAANGEGMHGNTDWQIEWNFQYDIDADDYCRITSVDVDLEVVIGLPKLSTRDRRTRERFAHYIVNLERHEQTHLRIARDGAYQIDRALLSMRPSDDCDQLERRANSLANRLINDIKRAQRQYDNHTEHGRTEGAWLAY
jgi:predicted secreted Zn-dependent protease